MKTTHNVCKLTLAVAFNSTGVTDFVKDGHTTFSSKICKNSECASNFCLHSLVAVAVRAIMNKRTREVEEIGPAMPPPKDEDIGPILPPPGASDDEDESQSPPPAPAAAAAVDDDIDQGPPAPVETEEAAEKETTDSAPQQRQKKVKSTVDGLFRVRSLAAALEFEQIYLDALPSSEMYEKVCLALVSRFQHT